jgi:hypothetical protein
MTLFEVSNRRRILRAAGAATALLCLLAIGLPVSAAHLSEVESRPGKPSKLSFFASSGGLRTLSPSACAASGISCNSTVSGTLTSDDCVLNPPDDVSNYDAWTFSATAGETVRISMTAAYDTVLFLFNSSGQQVAFNDDISDTNRNSLITLNVTRTDTYTIWANSYFEGVTGAYSLGLQCSGVGPPPTCTSSATELCLNGGRFRVNVVFSAPSLGITNAPAQAVPLTSDTGYFWFFSSNNIELVIKAVDGRAFNQHYWVFYGALSDVQYTITVTDTVTGAVKTYSNAAGQLASVADVVAFPGGAAGTAEAEGTTTVTPEDSMGDLVRARSREIAALIANSASAVCLQDATTLCLNGGRFQVRVSFNAPSLGITNGSAQAVPLTADTGYMWFFSANNVELVIKVVDGRAFNQFFWVFYGALSDVEYTITVTDSETGTVKTYHNAPGTLASVADVAAFR